MDGTGVSILKLPKLPLEAYSQRNPVAYALAEKYRTFRLHALRQAPQAFASSYEIEKQRDVNFTLNRLSLAEATHFLAVNQPTTSWTPRTEAHLLKELLQVKWLGMIVLIGPSTQVPSIAVSAKRDPLAGNTIEQNARVYDETESKHLYYHLNGVFVDSEVRRMGLGRALVSTALAMAGSEGVSRRSNIRCGIFVDSKNGAARKLYEKVGFRSRGTEDYVQTPRLEMAESKPETRVAVRLEIEMPFIG